MTKDEALNLAIEVLQKNIWCDDDCNCSDRQAITAIKEALAQRTWVGLRDDEIYSVLENLQVMHHRPPTTDSRVIFAQAIEAKLKEKNT